MLREYYTSTIGSFPLIDTEDNRKRCLEDLIALGIDYPAYPQLTDMGRQFLDELASQDSGIIPYRGEYKIAGREISVDVKPPGLEPFLWTINYIERRGLKIKIKAPVTGPFTLASYIIIDDDGSMFNRAIANIAFVEQIAQIVSNMCSLISRKAEMISIDEPILSVIVGSRVMFRYGEGEIKRILNTIREKCGDVLAGIHVCGRISPKLASILLETDLDFLSHEFHDTPDNIRVYSPESIRKSGKILSIGCLSSRYPVVESVDEILSVARKFKEYGERLIFTPDCGFRNLIINGSREKGYEVALGKLRNMVLAVSNLRKEG
ncbi:MAG: hypothetical protein QXR84_03270 [Candidatus Bathyarchaeia archaeon]|nr:hypothetical protein [Candidatus Bathyarchaeota archaeon]